MLVGVVEDVVRAWYVRASFGIFFFSFFREGEGV
jgi:hypothetical protein